MAVSIHAPGRGATSLSYPTARSPRVSIHAPGRGATVRHGFVYLLCRVSIHAPGRGATCWLRSFITSPSVSIHAPGRGATPYRKAPKGQHLCFNSRTREGCDLLVEVVYNLTVSFNSRTREGCDSVPKSSEGTTPVFQFTHPGGVRRAIRINYYEVKQVSIHAPGRGATKTIP